MGSKQEQRIEKIETLVERAMSAHGGGDWYEAERFACEAMELAYKCVDFTRMGAAVEALLECRLSRREEALASEAMYAFDHAIGEDDYELAEGCWLIEPPRVGADGRDLREMASREKIAMVAVCREPETMLGQWPLVAVGPVVVRTKVRPPSEITPSWFVEAIEALAQSAIGDVDPESSAIDRVEELLLRVQAIPDSEALHVALLDACREAAAAEARANGRRGTGDRSAA